MTFSLGEGLKAPFPLSYSALRMIAICAAKNTIDELINTLEKGCQATID